MGFTPPRTWVTGETITDTLLNTHLRDNLLALRTPEAADPPAAGQLTAGSICKGWAKVTLSGGVPTLADDYNVAAIADNGVGDFTIIWDRDFANAGYAWAGGVRSVTNYKVLNEDNANPPAGGAIRVKVAITTTGALADDDFSIIAFGDQ
jgi:hypothetical protein